MRGIAQVINLHHAPGAPAGESGNEIRNAGIAFPPVLVRVVKVANDHGDAAGLGRVGHVPNFMRGVAKAAQQVVLAFVRVGQAGAYARHLRAAGFSRGVGISGLAGNVREIFGLGWIGNIED
jgi:hypothetical protein